MKNDGNGPVYYHENGLGSAIALTSGSGNVVERYTYDAYGQPTITDAGGTSRYFSAYGNRMLFTGREWIRDARIYDYRNRTYSPAIGRFMETDPIGYEGGDVNLYRYVANDPVNFFDPEGLKKLPDPPFPGLPDGNYDPRPECDILKNCTSADGGNSECLTLCEYITSCGASGINATKSWKDCMDAYDKRCP